jgi:hypothetical protein
MSIKVIGKMVNEMDMVHSFSQMDVNIKDILLIVVKMALD